MIIAWVIYFWGMVICGWWALFVARPPVYRLNHMPLMVLSFLGIFSLISPDTAPLALLLCAVLALVYEVSILRELLPYVPLVVYIPLMTLSPEFLELLGHQIPLEMTQMLRFVAMILLVPVMGMAVFLLLGRAAVRLLRRDEVYSSAMVVHIVAAVSLSPVILSVKEAGNPPWVTLWLLVMLLLLSCISSDDAWLAQQQMWQKTVLYLAVWGPVLCLL